MKNSWKSVHPFFHNSTNNYGFRIKKNQSWIQGVNHRDTKMFQIVLCLMYNLSWKFHENPFIRLSIIVLTNTHSQNRKINPEFKELITTTRFFFSDCSLYHVQYFLKISWQSVHPFSRNVANRHGFPWKKRYNKPVSWSYILLFSSVLVSKGLNITPPNFSDCSLDLAMHILKISWKSVHAFPVMLANTQTNQPTEMKT